MKRNAVREGLAQLRRAVAYVRDRLDGRLHSRRRERAAARLRDLAPSSILFVCLGNICRSPYAARVMRGRARLPLSIESAGYLGPGRPPPAEALQVARARGVEHADHVSALATREQLAAADVTFVFDRFNVRDLRRSSGARLDRVLWLGDFDPEWAGKRAIADPWGRPLDDYEATFARIERCVAEVLRILERR